MATPAHRLLQDQNLNLLYHGGATSVGKANLAKADKKGGFGGRKALNDISNSRNQSVVQSKKKDHPKNVISIEKDARVKLSKVPEKGKIGGRKALADLTNSVKPSSQQLSSGITRKLDSVAEENVPSSIAKERFLHNHQECIKAQTKALDVDYFLKLVGLNNEMPSQLSAKQAFRSSSDKHLEIDEIPACKKNELPGYYSMSPVHQSPKSAAKPPYTKWEDDNLSDLMVLIETPKLLKLQ